MKIKQHLDQWWDKSRESRRTYEGILEEYDGVDPGENFSRGFFDRKTYSFCP